MSWSGAFAALPLLAGFPFECKAVIQTGSSGQVPVPPEKAISYQLNGEKGKWS